MLTKLAHFIIKFSLSNKNKNIDRAIISNVSSIDNFIIEKKINLKHTYFLSDELKLPFTNKYESKKTLGSDRKALVSAAIKYFSDTNTLIIDAGTCITIDFIDENGNYHGGSISPGLSMRLKSLHTFTDKLPLVELKKPEKLIGGSTKESILSGVVGGMSSEINNLISEYHKKYSLLKVFVTGGDVDFIYPMVDNQKSSIFAHNYITLLGLNRILQENVS